jgi:hypothetical protein
VERTLHKLEEILKAKGIKQFALVDHSGEAEQVGMKMPPTKLLIFGNPKAGTPLMVATPRIAIDLPLKVLIWEDAGVRSGSHTMTPGGSRNAMRLAMSSSEGRGNDCSPGCHSTSCNGGFVVVLPVLDSLPGPP